MAFLNFVSSFVDNCHFASFPILQQLLYISLAEMNFLYVFM